MKVESVEIYSDASNAVVMRHPGRHFPGVLMQGDTLHSIVSDIEAIQQMASLPAEAAEGLSYLHERLNDLLQHYKTVLTAHSVELPFNDASKS